MNKFFDFKISSDFFKKSSNTIIKNNLAIIPLSEKEKSKAIKKAVDKPVEKKPETNYITEDDLFGGIELDDSDFVDIEELSKKASKHQKSLVQVEVEVIEKKNYINEDDLFGGIELDESDFVDDDYYARVDNLIEFLESQIQSKEKFDNKKLQKIGKDYRFDIESKPSDLKTLQECFESAMVLYTSQIAKQYYINSAIFRDENTSDLESYYKRLRDLALQNPNFIADDLKKYYDLIVEAYNNQPRLEARTQTSTKLQQYSTPAPISFILQWFADFHVLANLNEPHYILEPTAGNGMLVSFFIGGDNTRNVLANELDPNIRLHNLEKYNFNTYNYNALSGDFSLLLLSKNYIDILIDNPPFASYRGQTKIVDNEFGMMNDIEQGISYQAFKGLKTGGIAILIHGGVLLTKDTISGLKIIPSKRNFFEWIYGTNDVIACYEIDGNVYNRQGANAPIHILIVKKGLHNPDQQHFAPYEYGDNFLDNQIKRLENFEEIFYAITKLKQELVLNGNNRTGDERPTDKPGLPVLGRAKNKRTGGNGDNRGIRNGLPPGYGGRTNTTGEPDNIPITVQTPKSNGSLEKNNEETQIRADVSGGNNGSIAPSTITGELEEAQQPTDIYAQQVRYISGDGYITDKLIPTAYSTPIKNSLKELRDYTQTTIKDFVSTKLLLDNTENIDKLINPVQQDAIALFIKNNEFGKEEVRIEETDINNDLSIKSLLNAKTLNEISPKFLKNYINFIYADTENYTPIYIVDGKLIITSRLQTIQFQTKLKTENGIYDLRNDLKPLNENNEIIPLEAIQNLWEHTMSSRINHLSLSSSEIRNLIPKEKKYKILRLYMENGSIQYLHKDRFANYVDLLLREGYDSFTLSSKNNDLSNKGYIVSVSDFAIMSSGFSRGDLEKSASIYQIKLEKERAL